MPPSWVTVPGGGIDTGLCDLCDARERLDMLARGMRGSSRIPSMLVEGPL